MTTFRMQLDIDAAGYLLVLRKNGKVHFVKRFLAEEMWPCMECVADLLRGGYKTKKKEILSDSKSMDGKNVVLVANTDKMGFSICEIDFLRPAFEEFIMRPYA